VKEEKTTARLTRSNSALGRPPIPLLLVLRRCFESLILKLQSKARARYALLCEEIVNSERVRSQDDAKEARRKIASAHALQGQTRRRKFQCRVKKRPSSYQISTKFTRKQLSSGLQPASKGTLSKAEVLALLLPPFAAL